MFLFCVSNGCDFLCVCFLFLKKKKNAGRKEHATGVGLPAEISSSSLFFIYNSFHASHHQFSLGLSIRKNYVCVTVFCSATFCLFVSCNLRINCHFIDLNGLPFALIPPAVFLVGST